MTRPPERGDQLDPDLVGINGPLTERMADPEGANNDLDQVFAPRFHSGNLRPDRAQKLAFDHTPFAQTEDVDSDLLVAQEPRMPFDKLLVSQQCR